MSAPDRPFVWQMIKQAVRALGGKTTNIAVRDWILARYPLTNRKTIGCQTIICTVNHPSRVHFQQNKQPRLAAAQYDFLIRPESGRLEFYSPRKHGRWEIARTRAGLIIRLTEAANAGASERRFGGGAGFGNAVTNKLVEQAAIRRVKRHLRKQGFAVVTRERERIGYDLDAKRPGQELHVEVKGIAGRELQFPITRGELLRATSDPLFVLIAVTRARSAAAELHSFEGRAALRLFQFEPLVFMATRRR